MNFDVRWWTFNDNLLQHNNEQGVSDQSRHPSNGQPPDIGS